MKDDATSLPAALVANFLSDLWLTRELRSIHEDLELRSIPIVGCDQAAILRAFEKALQVSKSQMPDRFPVQSASKLIVEHLHLFVIQRTTKHTVAV